MCVVLIHTTLQLWIGSHQNEEFFVFAFFRHKTKNWFLHFLFTSQKLKKIVKANGILMITHLNPEALPGHQNQKRD